MKLKVNKAALSIATAFLMVSPIATTITSAAAGTNEITIYADKSTAVPGDKINVVVGYKADKTGIAGFTINLQYDPNKVEVSNDAAASNSNFSVITNNNADKGEIKIVGANMDASNVTDDSQLAVATFTVKEGAKGDIDYWTDVETMVRADGDGFENASYSAPTAKSPVSVSVPGAVTTTTTAKQTTKATTTEKTTTTTKTSTTTTKAAVSSAQTTTTTPAAVTTAPQTTSEPTKSTTQKSEQQTSAVTDETTLSESTKAPAAVTTKESATSTENVSSDKNEETANSDVSKPAETTSAKAEETQKPDETTQKPEETITPLFEHLQGDEDYNSESPIQYGFKISDYISDYAKNYNVNVKINTNGNVNGALGMMTGDGSWNYEKYKNSDIYDSSDIEWTYENLDPNAVNDDMFLQLFYLKSNTNFKVMSVEFIPVDSVEEGSFSDSSNILNNDPTANENESDITEEAEEKETTEENSMTTESEKAEEPDSMENTSVSSEPDEQAEVSSITTSEEEIKAAVDTAASKAENAPSSANPDTGSGKTVMNLLTFAAIGEIAFSIFTVIYNKITFKKKEEE